MVRLVQHTTAGAPSPSMSLSALDEAVRAADPAALVVAPRILRRVIKQSAGVGVIGLRVPHRKSYVISRDELLAIVDISELDLDDNSILAEHVILLARPTTESLEGMTVDEALTKYWRLLFHARVHLAFEQLIAESRLTPSDVEYRVQQIGDLEFDEIRAVLRQEDYLLPPKSDLSIYVEFVAVFLELRHFMPSLLRSYFPGLQDVPYVDELLKHDVDGEAIFMATRLPGAPEPNWSDVPSEERMGLGPPPDESLQRESRVPARNRSDRKAAALLTGADRARRLGNLVRAAILRTRAARLGSDKLTRSARDEAQADLSALAQRLQGALNFTAHEAEEWSKSLQSLIELAARGIWTAEARMLYDLQKVCVDHERGIYTLDLLGWAWSLGRKPLKRFLPGQRDVLMSKHLRSAAHRLPSARISNRARSRLARLLQSSAHRAETNLRARFKPGIDRALDRVKLLPQNPPERVARKKLVDEILDRVVERGFLSMGDLRDAFSRNNLKLPDLASAKQFLLGDQLLQADRQLTDSMDGVYRGGEIYLRWPQRLSSLAFGTPFGRFLTRYAALPFGGAYILLEGLQHLVAVVVHAFSDTAHVQLATPTKVLLLGLFILGVLYHERFRAWCLDVIARSRQAFHSIVVDLPTWLSRLPQVQMILGSWQFRVFKQYVFKPLVISALAAPVIALLVESRLTLNHLLAIFAVVNLLINTPLGRNVDEMVTDWIVITWHRIRIHVFAAVFRLIMDVFNRILETIERLLYTVDEWLRFRAGERTSATVVKAVLGFLWFFVNYVIRFGVNLLVEPQVNPIKHFPVVTVSHKILLPLTPALQSALSGPLGPAWATAVATTVILLTPGMFGFLVWELKENWRLYAANRPPNLQSIPLGHHGETMLQFLRPGFRSGTVPKLYAKLRRASRRALYTHNWRACSKQLTGLHHVAEAVRRFVDRELLTMLHESRSWSDRSIATGEIRLGSNRILIELYCPNLGEDSMWLAFDEQSGWLVAGIYRRGWSDTLSYQRRRTLASALAGLYKMAGVELVREQIEDRLEADSRGYEITDEALIVWAHNNSLQQIVPLRNWTAGIDEPSVDEPTVPTVVVSADERAHWVFQATPISWRRWVLTWELDELGGTKHQVLENMHLLPS